MFSCSHFRNFLADRIEKQSAMSKRGEEATSSEGSPMAKPKPMVPAKARPVNLVLRSPWSARENLPQDLGYSVNPGIVHEGQGDYTSTRRLVRTTQNPQVELSNVRRQENAQNSDSWKQGDQEESSNSTSTCTGSDSKNRISKEPSTHDEDLPCPTKEVGNYSRIPTFSMEAWKTNVLTWERSCLRQWKQPFILDRIIWRTWRFTRTRTSRKFRAYSISHRNLYWSFLKKFWMWIRLKVQFPHGRDQFCFMIKWSIGQNQRHLFTQTLFNTWGSCQIFQKQTEDGKAKWQTFNWPLLTKELLGIDGEPIEFEWNIFPRHTSLEMLQKIQNDLQERNIELEDFWDWIIFMSMFNDIKWTRKETMEICISISQKVKMYAKRFSQGHWTFLGLRDEKKWYGTLPYTPEGKMGLCSHSNGGTIQRNRSSSILEHQCFESGNSEKKEQQRHHTLQRGCFKHRTLLSNDSLSKSAQYLRSSLKLVWRVRSNIVFTRSELFGMCYKDRTSIWKKIARMSSELGITDQNQSTYESLLTRIVLAKGRRWYEL